VVRGPHTHARLQTGQRFCPELCPRIGESNLPVTELRKPIHRDSPTA
jgi:hypothetical protein